MLPLLAPISNRNSACTRCVYNSVIAVAKVGTAVAKKKSRNHSGSLLGWFDVVATTL